MEYCRSGNYITARLDKGEEILSALSRLCTEQQIHSGLISGFGAVDQITLGIFRTEPKKYESRNLEGEYEIASLTGTISVLNDSPYLHVHAAVADPVNGIFHGGHLSFARISATAELVITVTDTPAYRRFDDKIGLQLLAFSEETQMPARALSN